MLFPQASSVLLYPYLQCVHSATRVAKVGPLWVQPGCSFNVWLAEHLSLCFVWDCVPVFLRPVRLQVVLFSSFLFIGPPLCSLVWGSRSVLIISSTSKYQQQLVDRSVSRPMFVPTTGGPHAPLPQILAASIPSTAAIPVDEIAVEVTQPIGSILPACCTLVNPPQPPFHPHLCRLPAFRHLAGIYGFVNFRGYLWDLPFHHPYTSLVASSGRQALPFFFNTFTPIFLLFLWFALPHVWGLLCHHWPYWLVPQWSQPLPHMFLSQLFSKKRSLLVRDTLPSCISWLWRSLAAFFLT